MTSPTADNGPKPSVSAAMPLTFSGTTTSSPQWICPDLLSIRQIGGADGWRGHLVRGFFRFLKLITGV